MVDEWVADEVLSNPTRIGIVKEIRRRKRMHISDLADALDKPWGNVAYHLGILENNGILQSEYEILPEGNPGRRGRLARFFWIDEKKLEEFVSAWRSLVESF